MYLSNCMLIKSLEMDGVVKHGWMVVSLKDNGEKIQEAMDK